MTVTHTGTTPKIKKTRNRFEVIPGYEDRTLIPLLALFAVLVVVSSTKFSSDPDVINLGHWYWLTFTAAILTGLFGIRFVYDNRHIL